MIRSILAIIFWAIAVNNLFAAAVAIPTADRKGSRDNPLLKRYEGSLIVAYEHKKFDEFTLPLSKLEQVPKSGTATTIAIMNPTTKSLWKEHTRNWCTSYRRTVPP